MTVAPTFVDPAADGFDDAPPVEFHVTYRGVDGKPTTETFHALPRGRVPYAWILDYFAAGAHPVESSNATLTFLRQVLLHETPAKPAKDAPPTDRERFERLIRDPDVAIAGKTLRDIQVFLIETYEKPDPTRARSAGQPRSPRGSRTTGRGSGGSSRKRAST